MMIGLALLQNWYRGSSVRAYLAESAIGSPLCIL